MSLPMLGGSGPTGVAASLSSGRLGLDLLIAILPAVSYLLGLSSLASQRTCSASFGGRLGSLGQDRAKLDRQAIGQTRLHQERRAPFADSALVRGRIAGHDHDRNVVRPRMALHVLNQVPPIVAR